MQPVRGMGMCVCMYEFWRVCRHYMQAVRGVCVCVCVCMYVWLLGGRQALRAGFTRCVCMYVWLVAGWQALCVRTRWCRSEDEDDEDIYIYIYIYIHTHTYIIRRR
jgi:hypothetical protein